jgi:MFS family permease
VVYTAQLALTKHWERDYLRNILFESRSSGMSHPSSSASATDTTSQFSKIHEWRDGWRVVLAASFGAGMTWNLFAVTAGMFIIPMQTDLGWSRTAVSVGPIIGLASSFMYPFAGILIDRFGARPIAIAGLILLCIGYLMFAVVPPDPIAFYSVAAYIAVVAAISNTIVYAKGIATWFMKNAGTAFGLATSGLSAVSVIIIPLLAHVMARYGWRGGYFVLAGAIAAAALPIVIIWFRERPDIVHVRATTPNLLHGVTVRDGARDVRFWMLIIFLACAILPIGGFMHHMQPLFVSYGFTTTEAAALVSTYALSMGISRIAAGIFLDRVRRPPLVAAVCMAFGVAGALLLASPTLGSSWIGATISVILIGVTQGAEADFLAFFTLRIFGLRSYSALFGILAIVVGSGLSLGGLGFAAMFDHYGSYHLAIYAGAASYLCSALIILLIRIPPADAISDSGKAGSQARSAGEL